MELTYAHEQEEDEEHVHDGQQRHGQRGDDLLERLDAAEEPDDAEGAEDADDAGGLVGDDERHDRHGDDEGVEQAPGVLDEGLEPVGEHIDRQLHREEEGEEEVQLVEVIRQISWGPVGVDEAVNELGLGDCAAEVL